VKAVQLAPQLGQQLLQLAQRDFGLVARLLQALAAQPGQGAQPPLQRQHRAGRAAQRRIVDQRAQVQLLADLGARA
jgi:hypothetical protein